MKIARLLMVLAALATFAFATTGCNKGKKAAGDMEKVADKACACEDEACAKAEWTHLKDVFSKNKDTRADDDTVARFAKAYEKAIICLAKLGIPPEEIQAFQDKMTGK